MLQSHCRFTMLPIVWLSNSLATQKEGKGINSYLHSLQKVFYGVYFLIHIGHHNSLQNKQYLPC